MQVFTATLAAALLPIPADSTLAGWSPSDVYPGWVSDGTNVSAPITSFPLLAAAEADGITGDARDVVFAMNYAAFAWYNAADPKPQAIKLSYTPGSIERVGDFIGKQKVTISMVAYLNFPGMTLADEP